MRELFQRADYRKKPRKGAVKTNIADKSGTDGGNEALRRSLAALLNIFGYEAEENDNALLDWAVGCAEGYIRNRLNIEYLTLDLAEPMLNMAAGEFLKAKKSADPESLKGLDLDPAVKRIEVGDTNTEFAVGDGSLTPEQRFDMLTERLVRLGKEQLKGGGRIKW
ncbi:MAG: hypothetical protein NC394_06795 [Bacteroides sp.]|nr:hypothetical protein [Bacteroides sp.]